MQSDYAVGVDVAKDQVVATSANGEFTGRIVANRPAALRAFLRQLAPGSCIGMEATGGYHEVLANLAHRQGFVVYVLNAKDTYHYARAVGLRAKTDRVDA